MYTELFLLLSYRARMLTVRFSRLVSSLLMTQERTLPHVHRRVPILLSHMFLSHTYLHDPSSTHIHLVSLTQNAHMHYTHTHT